MASTLRFDNWEDSNGTPILDGTNLALPSSAMPAGSILQVVSTTKTDTFSATVAAGAYTAVTGLSASITPSSTSSKILVLGFVSVGGGSALSRSPFIKLLRGATLIGAGDSAGSRALVHSGANAADAGQAIDNVVLNFLDSPATTSSVTYSVEIGHSRGGTETVVVNSSRSDTDSNGTPRSVSTITLMEVAG